MNQTLALTDFDLRYRALRLEDPAVLAAMERSVHRHGVLQPLVVHSCKDASAVLLDGFKRFEVLKKSGAEHAPVRWLDVDEREAPAAIIASNRPHRGLTALEEAWVVQRLIRVSRLARPAVGVLLGRHKSWVCRRLALAERLQSSVQDDIRLGLVSGTVARTVALLPRGNQAEVVDAITRHGLSSRQTESLVKQWLACADGDVRAAIVAEPLTFVGGRPSTAPADDVSALESVRRCLSRLEAAAIHARRTVPQWVAVVSPTEGEALSHPLRRAQAALADVAPELERAAASWQESDNGVA